MIIEIASILGIVAVAIIALYTLTRFREWVRLTIGRTRNKNLVSGFLREHMESGDYKVKQFIFNENVGAVVEEEVVQVKIFEEDLEQKIEDDIFLDTGTKKTVVKI